MCLGDDYYYVLYYYNGGGEGGHTDTAAMDERAAAAAARQDFQGLVGPAAAAHSPWRTGDGGTSSFLKERKGKVLPFLYYGIYYNKKMVFFFFLV